MSRDSTLSFWVEKRRLYLWFCISGSFYNKHSERLARVRKVSDRPQQQWNCKLAPDLNAIEGVALGRTHFISPNNDKWYCTPQLCDDWIILCVETLICLLYFLSTSTLQHKKNLFSYDESGAFYTWNSGFFPFLLLHAIFVCFTKCLYMGICLFAFAWYDFVLTLLNFFLPFCLLQNSFVKIKMKTIYSKKYIDFPYERFLWAQSDLQQWMGERKNAVWFVQRNLFFYKSEWNVCLCKQSTRWIMVRFIVFYDFFLFFAALVHRLHLSRLIRKTILRWL